MSTNPQAIHIAVSKPEKTQDIVELRRSSLKNTTEQCPKIDLSQRINSHGNKVHSDDISEMSAPLSDVEPETTATALRTKTISQR